MMSSSQRASRLLALVLVSAILTFWSCGQAPESVADRLAAVDPAN